MLLVTGIYYPADLLNLDQALVVIPGIIYVSGYFSQLEISKAWYPRHGLVVLKAIYHQFTFHSVFHEANHTFKIIFQVIRIFKWRINTSQSRAVGLMAVAAVFDIKLFALPEVVGEFGFFILL